MGEAPEEVINPVLEATRVDGPSMTATPIGEDVGVELAFWDTIKDSGSVAELDAYLTRYPEGPFNVQARTRRDALIAVDESGIPAKEDALAVELAFWEAAKESGSSVELEAYLDTLSRRELCGAGRSPVRKPARAGDRFNGNEWRSL
jgi:adenylate cyclase